MKEGTCRTTATGRKYCKRGGRVRFVSGASSVSGRKRKSRMSGKTISLTSLAKAGISGIQGKPGTCMTAVRSKGGTQKVCFGAQGRFVTPFAGADGISGRRKTRKRSKRRYV